MPINRPPVTHETLEVASRSGAKHSPRSKSSSEQAAAVDWLLATMFFLSVWAPPENIGYPAILETLRYILYPIVGALFILNRGFGRGDERLGTPTYWLIATVGYWCFSTLWSDELLFSIQRSVLVAVTLLVTLSAATSLPPRRVTTTLVTVLAAYVVAGALFAIFVPHIGVESSYQHVGKWRGLAGQKNTFGMMAVLTALLLLSGKDALPAMLTRISTLRWALVAVCLVCVYQSESRGALVGLAMGIFVLGFLRLRLPHQRYWIGLVLGVLPILLALVLGSVSVENGVLSILGADLDTSNRTAIWGYGFSEWSGRELLGTGYGGFWTQGRTDEFLTFYRWVLPNFHNGYISVLIETGIVGAVLLATSVIASLWNIMMRLGDLSHGGTRFFVCILVVALTYAAFENTLSRSTNIMLVMFMFGVASTSLRRPTKRATMVTATSRAGDFRDAQLLRR